MDAQNTPRAPLAEVVDRLFKKHYLGLLRVQLFAEIARLGFQQALVAQKADPSKPLHKQLAGYLASQQDQFYDQHQYVVVSLWSILEAFVGEVALEVVQQIDWSNPPPKFPKISCDVSLILGSSAGARAELVLSKVEDKVGAALRSNVSAFEEVLDAIGLGGPMHERVRNLIFHLASYRHCIVHNDGIVDADLCAKVPVFRAAMGTRLGVTSVELREFLFATVWYLNEVSRRAVLSCGGAVSDAITREQAKMLSLIEKCDIPPTSIPFAAVDVEVAKNVVPGSQILIVGPPEPN